MLKIKNVKSCINNKKIELVILVYLLIVLVAGLSLQSSHELIEGFSAILTSPGILITDYMVVGGIGPALVNGALVGLIGFFLLVVNKVNFTGYSIAAVFTMMGFGFMGKNVFSICPLILGVFIYSKLKKEKFATYIYPALFSTALAPVLSQAAFGFGWNLFASFLIGTLAGILISPIATHTLTFHKGYNLYNMGFAAGIVGLVFMSLFIGLGYDTENPSIWGNEFDQFLKPFIIILCSSMIILGILLGRSQKINYGKILKSSGVLISDYVIIAGFPTSLINMGLVGLIGVTYIILVGGSFNGPTLGGIFTMIGFAAFGKHPRNIIPIMIGVYLGSIISVYDTTSPGSMLAALYGTCLAPIAGKYGPIVGIFAGFIHLQLVSNLSYLHGGLNLYNNGFSAGFVAMFIVTVIEGFKKHK